MTANLMGLLFNLNFAKGMVLSTSSTTVTAMITIKSSFPERSIKCVDAMDDRNKMATKRKIKDTEDRNYLFMKEVNRCSENIIYRLQDLQMKL